MSSCALELRSELGSYAMDPQLADDLELLARREARQSFLPFCRYVTPWFQTPRHIEFLAPWYEAVERGDIDRLMVLMPPRHGKTNLGLHFLSWYLGRNPQDEIVIASYNTTIAGHFGGKVRNLLQRPEYTRLNNREDKTKRPEEPEFGATLDPELKGRELFQTTAGGVMRAAGLSGGTSGFGGHGLLIDDFVKGRKEADSPVTRADISETYSGELYPRLMPRTKGRPGWVLMEYTPWHPEDLGQDEISHMKAGDGDEWWVIRLPAIAEADDVLGRQPGEALWPERYPRPVLDRIQRVLDRKNPRDFPALYQCRPAALEGTFYKLSMMPDLDREKVGRVSYLIVTDWGAGGDETAHGVFSVDKDTEFELVDVWHESCDPGIGTEALLDLIATYRAKGAGVRGWIHAKGLLDKASRPLAATRAKLRNIPLPPEFDYNESGDKLAMSGSIQGYMLGGSVRFDHRASWWPWFRDQCIAFTGADGAPDEAPDLLKMLGLHMDKVIAPPKTAMRPVISKQWGLGAA